MSVDITAGVGIGIPLPYEKFGRFIEDHIGKDDEFSDYIHWVDGYAMTSEANYWFGVSIESTDYDFEFINPADFTDQELIDRIERLYTKLTGDTCTAAPLVYIHIW